MKHCCCLCPHHGLKVAANQQVEPLVRASELHVRLDRHRVVGLEQRVQQLRDGYGLLRTEPLGEVVPCQELRHCEAPCEVDHAGQRELAEPLALPHCLRTLPVHQLEELLHVGLRVGPHLFGGEHRARGGLAAGVAYLRGPVAHNQDDLVAQLLQLAQLPQADGVAQMNVRPAGVETHLEPEGFALAQEANELLLNYYVGHAAPDNAV